MNYMTKQSILDRLEEHYRVAEKYGDVFGVFLQGSQNYTDKLNDPESDLDSTALIVPDFQSFCLNHKPLSQTYVMENDEHVNLKDIREFSRLLLKSNTNTLEVLYTRYFIVNPKYQKQYDELMTIRDLITRYDRRRLYAATKGMAYRNYKLFQESLVESQPHTYNGKALAHVIRLQHFLESYNENKDFNSCLTSTNANYMLKIKRNNFLSNEKASTVADNHMNKLLALYDDLTALNIPRQKSTKERVDQYLIDLFKYKFKMSE